MTSAAQDVRVETGRVGGIMGSGGPMRADSRTFLGISNYITRRMLFNIVLDGRGGVR